MLVWVAFSKRGPLVALRHLAMVMSPRALAQRCVFYAKGSPAFGAQYRRALKVCSVPVSVTPARELMDASFWVAGLATLAAALAVVRLAAADPYSATFF